jgi:3'-phosphoadenosine 5'-phosphosulfate (PAPS) 3'-phosphatase
MEWDTASGQILSELKGAKVRNLLFKDKKFFLGEDLLYKKPQFINGAFIVDLHQSYFKLEQKF